MSTPHLELEMQQSPRITPWTLQSLSILEMDITQLSEFVDSALLENPMLERTEYPFEQNTFGNIHLDDISSLPEMVSRNPDPMDSLSFFLFDQLSCRSLSKPLMAVCTYLVKMLDDDGFLQEEDLSYLSQMGVPNSLLHQAVDTIQSLEPAGVGALSLRQCLLLQLRRNGQSTPLLERIINGHLEDIARQAYGRIMQNLNISEDLLFKQCAILRKLDPHPCATFSINNGEANTNILPDFLVEYQDGKLVIRTCRNYEAQLHLSHQYETMLRDTTDDNVRNYLTEHLKRAQWIITCIKRRAETLNLCGQELLSTQYCFFDGSIDDPRPMTMASLAAAIGVSPSTITRALKGKYLQCNRGFFPISYFFSRTVGNNDLNRSQIQNTIRQLINGEDKLLPYRDQQIADLLSDKGICVTRRTVTKYRQQMGFPSGGNRRIKAYSSLQKHDETEA